MITTKVQFRLLPVYDFSINLSIPNIISRVIFISEYSLLDYSERPKFQFLRPKKFLLGVILSNYFLILKFSNFLFTNI